MAVKDDRVVGKGYHRRAGGDHAEVVALKRAGANARGATLYVTLEPCSTHGRTPPCTDRIIGAGLARVVCGAKDPNPAHAGRGLAILRRAGIDAAMLAGPCAADCAELMAPFGKWITTGRPFVTLKLGMTLDGRIADAGGVSRWITGGASRREVQRLRRRVDAVMVGAGTACTDDPSLRCAAPRRKPLMRVIVDSRGRLPLTARVLTDEFAAETIVATTAASAERAAAYRETGVTVWTLRASRGRVSLRTLLGRLGREGLLHVLCEGGGELAAALVRERLVDRYRVFIAPRFLGGRGTPAIGGTGWRLADGPRLRFTAIERVGEDIMATAVPSE